MITQSSIESAVFEKKYWMPVTHLCNNNCIFCLMDLRSKTHHRITEEIKKEIDAIPDKENTRLIVSGGDPTIHPEIISIITYANRQGFKSIQLITNGRMLAYRLFSDKIIKAGLNEITFSIHGHTPEMHDSLTRSKGSFKQVMAGVKNVRAHKNIIINTDIVITKQNYRFLENIVTLLMDKGIMELNLHSITPYGNAYDNLELIDYEFDAVTPYVHAAIDACKKRGAVLWMSRFPPQYLYGYEEFILDSYKIFDQDLKPTKQNFQGRKIPFCKGKRCKYCSINIFCNVLAPVNKRVLNKDPFDYVKISILEDTFSKKIKDKICRSRQFSPKKIIFEGSLKSPALIDAISYAQSEGFENIQLNIQEALKQKQLDVLLASGVTEVKITIEDLNTFDLLASQVNLSIPAIFKIIINKQNYKSLEELAKRIAKLKPISCVLSFVAPQGKLYESYFSKVEELPKIIPFLEKAIQQLPTKVEIENIPACFLNERERKLIKNPFVLDLNDLTDCGELDVLEFSKKNLVKVKIKGVQCGVCKFNNDCVGVFKKCIRLYGFKQLKPVLSN